MQSIVVLVLIVAMTAIAIVYLVLGHQSRHMNNLSDDRYKALEKQLHELTKRIENVETIITSKSWQVDQEFENLQKNR